MSFQGLSKEFGKVNELLKLKGTDLIGLPLTAPLSKYSTIYTLPMFTISTQKGTGIVTSVPSDAPDDYCALNDLKSKQALRDKFNIKDEIVLPFEILPIIDIPKYGDMSAVKVCQQFKITSQNQKNLLEEAKQLVYRAGFYEGTLLVGPYQGRKVIEVKGLIKEDLINSKQAVAYSEPADTVMSRSGDVCVVALTDQWYLNYGESKWKNATSKCLSQLETYSPETRKIFETTLDWLNQWACSRTYGLGTKLPWDPQYLIESLSDSTIYMAYYTVAHLLQGGNLEGNVVGPAGIKPEQLTREVWDYIFLNRPYPTSCGIPESTLRLLQNEYHYWYPVDLRVSGKDLIQNHLTFFLYNHTALFQEEKWPKGIRANGFLLLNGEKMSKQTGNFLTLIDGINKYSADAMRLALADAGDQLDDANFTDVTANAAILRIYTLIEWINEILSAPIPADEDEPYNFADRVFDSQINKAIVETYENYEKTNCRDVLKSGFYDLHTARDNYRASVGKDRMKRKLVLKFIEVQALIISPITPHVSEYIWRNLLKKEGFIVNAKWPQAGPVDFIILSQDEYLRDQLHEFRNKLQYVNKPKKGKEANPASGGTIFVASSYPLWQEKVITIFSNQLNSKLEENEPLDKIFKSDPVIQPNLEKAMSFLTQLKANYQLKGKSVLALTTPFDEKKLVQDNLESIKKTLELKSLEVKAFIESDPPPLAKFPTPGNPVIMFQDAAGNKL